MKIKIDDGKPDMTPFEKSDVPTKKLKCGLEIALEDYYEINEDGSKKTEFTFDEALEIPKKTSGKWRVPTVVEWTRILLELGSGENGDFDRDAFVGALKLTEDEDGRGSYWSSTVRSDTLARRLYFSSTYIYPQNYNNRNFGFSVRCVKGVSNEVV